MYLCIDPGPELSGYVVINMDGSIREFGKEANKLTRARVKSHEITFILLERPDFSVSNGMSMLDTCVEVGRFIEASNGKYLFQFGRQEMKTFFKVKKDADVVKLVRSKGIKLVKDAWQAYLLWLYYEAQQQKMQ